jgi:hypothetical protein
VCFQVRKTYRADPSLLVSRTDTRESQQLVLAALEAPSSKDAERDRSPPPRLHRTVLQRAIAV